MDNNELLESIRRKGTMMRFLAKYQGQLMNEARARGIDEQDIVDAQRSSPDRTMGQRARDRNRNRKVRGAN